MNATPSNPSTPSEIPFARGQGYLTAMGYLQIVAGALTVLFSCLAMLKASTLSGTVLMSPAAIHEAFGGFAGGGFTKFMAGYMSFLVMFGWILGLMMISAGIASLKCRGRYWIGFVSILNLFSQPLATTVAMMMLHGLTRPRITAAFR